MANAEALGAAGLGAISGSNGGDTAWRPMVACGFDGGMDALLISLGEHFGPMMLLLGGLFAVAESAIGLGFIVPGETAVLTLGAATTTVPQLSMAILTVAVGASTGDHIGYLLGRRYGHRLRESRAIRRIGQRHWDRASRLLRRYGVPALIVSRLLPGVRTMVPAAAGASGLSYRRFLVGSVLGAGLWSGLWVGVGAAARAALPGVVDMLGVAGLVMLSAVVLALVVVFLRRRGGSEGEHADIHPARSGPLGERLLRGPIRGGGRRGEQQEGARGGGEVDVAVRDQDLQVGGGGEVVHH